MQVSRLFIYPIKSCAGIEVQQLDFDRYGPAGDRRFMLVDMQGKFLSQRQLPAMAHIYPQPEFNEEGALTGLSVRYRDGEERQLVLNRQQQRQVTVWKDSFVADDCGDQAADWFSSVLERDCRLVVLPENSERQVSLKHAPAGRFVGFADGYPLLVINQGSLDELGRLLGREMEAERFRPNIVVEGAQPFSELNWPTLRAEGGGELAIVKPCERCVIPTRNLTTLEREGDVLEVLKNNCRIDGKIIFGQNAIERSVDVIRVGSQLTP